MKDPRSFERARKEFRRKTAHLSESESQVAIEQLVEQVRSQPATTRPLLLGVIYATSEETGHSEAPSTRLFSYAG